MHASRMYDRGDMKNAIACMANGLLGDIRAQPSYIVHLAALQTGRLCKNKEGRARLPDMALEALV